MAVFEYIGGGGGSSDVVGYPAGTKMYVALLTQSGTDAPTATVLNNTLGGTVVWTRTDIGQYRATVSGVFTANKTFVLPFYSFLNLGDTIVTITTTLTDTNYVRFNVFNSSDLSPIDLEAANVPIYVLVFP